MNEWECFFLLYFVSKGTSIGQFTRLLRSLELRAVSHCTVLLLWDQKLLFRMRDCFEGSIIHLPTLWLDAVDACMTCLQVWFLASLLSYVHQKMNKTRSYCLSCCKCNARVSENTRYTAPVSAKVERNKKVFKTLSHYSVNDEKAR